jgi:adhesin/invasin
MLRPDVSARYLPHRTRALSRVALLTAAVGLGACEKATEPLTPASLVVVQGNRQTAAAGTLLPTPIIVRVRATDGSPVEGVPVGFAVQLGNGVVEPATALSDANGEARTRWTLGANQHAHELLTSVPGVEPVVLTATGIVPNDLLIAQGNNQTAKAGTALPVQIVLRVVGTNNTPIPNVPITLSVTSGGGSLNPASATTNAAGEVTVRWTLGNQAGLQNVQATALNLSPVILSASGT